MTDMVVTDVIAENMKFVEGSLKVDAYGDITDKVVFDYDAATRKMTIKIPKDVFYMDEQHLKPVTITYRTELEDAFFEDVEVTKTFTNTASVTQDGTTTDASFKQNVTRQVVGKSGSYDKKNKVLSYNIIVNPEASRLNEGDPLLVEDKLNAGSIASRIEL